MDQNLREHILQVLKIEGISEVRRKVFEMWLEVLQENGR